MPLLVQAPSASAQTNPRFRVIDITRLSHVDVPPANHFIPDVDLHGSMGINNHGEVVYAWKVGDVLHPFVWLPESLSTELLAGFNDLYTLVSEVGIARDINDDHMIVGQRGSGLYYTEGDEACVWDLEAAAEDYFYLLGTFDALAKDWSGANAINNDIPPIIVGQSAARFANCGCPLPNGVDPLEHLSKHLAFKATFLGDPNPTLTELNPSGVHMFNSCYAMGLSTVAQAGSPLRISGGSLCKMSGTFCGGGGGQLCDPLFEATYWTSDAGANLNVITTDVDASGRRMSGDGHVAGWGKDLTTPPGGGDATCIRHVFYWESPTSLHTDLNQFVPSGQVGNAFRGEDVNNGTLPSVVGWDEVEGGMLWEKQSATVWNVLNLNTTEAIGADTTKWAIKEAHAINDNGWMGAVAFDLLSGPPFVLHAVVLVPYIPCPGDLNGDDFVNVDDLIIVINGWGPCAGTCPPSCQADTDHNCTVNVDDLIVVINGWGICAEIGSSGAPMDVESCYEKTRERYPDTGSQQFIEAFDRCIESLCIRGLLPDCD